MTTLGVDDSRPLPDRRLRLVAGSDADRDAVMAILDRTLVRVTLPAGPPTWRHQVLVLALVDMLGRLFPNIEITCDAEASADLGLPPGDPLLRHRLDEVARNGALNASAPRDDTIVTIVIGDAEVPDPAAGPIFYADGGGWQSYNGTTPSRLVRDDWPMVPIGPLAAACRSAAQATAAALDPTSVQNVKESAYASALTYQGSSDPIEEGHAGSASAWHDTRLDALLGGAGSIGGAAAYAFARTPALTGRLVIADPQHLEKKNLDRALLATAAATATEAWKADVAADALSHLVALDVVAVHGTVAEWVAGQPQATPLPLVLAAVDSRDARREIQDCLPLDLVNAACGVDEITVSGHQTGNGPCVCCLHMEEVLDAQAVRVRLLSRATGMNPRMVAIYLVKEAPLEPHVIRSIEKHRGLAPGALAQYEQQTLEDLRKGALLYGQTKVDTETGTVAVAAPYVTALAGVLLAAEALKRATPELAQYALGPGREFSKLEERVDRGPIDALTTKPARWNGSECLCQSTRRLRLIAARYPSALS